MEDFILCTPYIQLDKLLKLQGVIATGGQIKLLITDKMLKINGEIIIERRKKVYPGDVVEVAGNITIKVVSC